jgi:hypothetical protein
LPHLHYNARSAVPMWRERKCQGKCGERIFNIRRNYSGG